MMQQNETCISSRHQMSMGGCRNYVERLLKRCCPSILVWEKIRPAQAGFEFRCYTLQVFKSPEIPPMAKIKTVLDKAIRNLGSNPGNRNRQIQPEAIRCRCPAPGAYRRRRGFTLLEMLVTIFIFAIIATTIFGSYNAVFSNAAAIKDDMMAYEMAKDCLNRIILDLQALYVSQSPAYTPPENAETQDPYRMVGETIYTGNSPFAKLRFASMAHLPLTGKKQEGIAEIIYYVRPAGDGKYTLRRSDNLILYGPSEEKESDPILCENLKSLSFKYYGSEGDEYDTWNSDSEDFSYSTPQAIAVKLAIGDNEQFQVFEALVKLQQYREKIKS